MENISRETVFQNSWGLLKYPYKVLENFLMK